MAEVDAEFESSSASIKVGEDERSEWITVVSNWNRKEMV